MSSKRRSSLDKVPSSESSDEDDSEDIGEDGDGDSRSEEEGEEEEQEDEKGQGDGKEEEEEGVGEKALASGVKSNTETDDGISESDSDPNSIQSHPSPTASDFTIKPISTDSKKSTKLPLQPRMHKPSKSVEVKKRSLDSESNGLSESRNRKKNKVSHGGDTPDKKMVWVEGDEIALLNALIEYQSKQRAHSNCGIPFHEFANKILRSDLSKRQVNTKVGRLKKKFHMNAMMGENGGEAVFSKLHEQKVFELGKKIWGLVEEGGGDKKGNKSGDVCDIGVDKKLVVVETETKHAAEEMDGLVDGGDVGEASPSYPWLESSMVLLLNSLPESCHVLGMDGVSLLGKTKAMEFDEKWRKMQVAEIEIYLKKLKLIKEQSKLIWDNVRIPNS